jgi:hypothetical protein
MERMRKMIPRPRWILSTPWTSSSICSHSSGNFNSYNDPEAEVDPLNSLDLKQYLLTFLR